MFSYLELSEAGANVSPCPYLVVAHSLLWLCREIDAYASRSDRGSVNRVGEIDECWGAIARAGSLAKGYLHRLEAEDRSALALALAPVQASIVSLHQLMQVKRESDYHFRRPAVVVNECVAIELDRLAAACETIFQTASRLLATSWLRKEEVPDFEAIETAKFCRLGYSIEEEYLRRLYRDGSQARFIAERDREEESEQEAEGEVDAVSSDRTDNPDVRDVQPAKSRKKPSDHTRHLIVAAIRSGNEPKQTKEILAALGLSTDKPGSIKHNLAWLCAKGVLTNLPDRGYWVVGDTLPECADESC